MRSGGFAAPGDASTEIGIAALVGAARANLEAIDVWCATAGTERGHGLQASEADWTLSLDGNLLAHVRAARLLIPDWVERGEGRFVVTASAAGLLRLLGNPVYSATKHAAVALAEWLSATYRHCGVHVHAICPQGVNTRMLAQSGPMKALLSHELTLEPEDIAEALWQATQDDRFLVLPHPEVADYYATRATQTDRWAPRHEQPAAAASPQRATNLTPNIRGSRSRLLAPLQPAHARRTISAQRYVPAIS